MAKLTHQSVTEFQLRGVIAGLNVLEGITSVRNAIENANPAAARTVIPALLAAAANESVTGQLQLHKSDFHAIRHLAKALEPLSAVTGVETSDVVITDQTYANAKADIDPAEQSLRESLIAYLQQYIPGFTGERLTNGGFF